MTSIPSRNPVYELLQIAKEKDSDLRSLHNLQRPSALGQYRPGCTTNAGAILMCRDDTFL